MLLAALTGVLTGLVVAAFDVAVVDGALERVGAAPLWVAAVLPTAGLAVAAVVLRLGGGRSGPPITPGTADEYVRAYHDPAHRLGLRRMGVRLAASLATLGSGAPMGMEGPALYAGASIGDALQRRLPAPLRSAEPRTLLVAGAAAGVAAIFKAPATGVVFALEVPFREDLARRMLLPALVASASGYLTFVALMGTTPLFGVAGAPDLGWRHLTGAVVVGVLAGLGARGFAAVVRAAKRLATRPALPRVLGAGAVLAAVFVAVRGVTGESLAVGGGDDVIRYAGSADEAVWVFVALLVLRCAGTATAIAGGGVGGVFIPLVVAGALAGRVAADLVGSTDVGLFVVVGAAAFLGAGYRVPLAAVVFVAETTGRPGFIVPGLLAAVAAELVVGAHASVTPYQRGAA